LLWPSKTAQIVGHKHEAFRNADVISHCFNVVLQLCCWTIVFVWMIQLLVPIVYISRATCASVTKC